MIDELRLNTKFFDIDGIIGRYDFCYNRIYLGMIALIFSLPLNLYLIANLGTIEDIFNLNKIWADAYLLLKIWILRGSILCAYIICINANRRLNDINGKVSKDTNLILSVLFILNAFGIIFPCPLAILLSVLNTVAILYLVLKKGEITGKYPYDYRK